MVTLAGGQAKMSTFANVARFAVIWKDLFHATIQAGFCAGFHLRFFDDLFAMLHPDTWLRTFVFVDCVAHAQTAPAAGLVFLHN